MPTLKTQPNSASVQEFLSSLENKEQRDDAFRIVHLMEELSGKKPQMWGDAIIGFDRYHYKYASGREGEWFKIGFSPRKNTISLYLMPGYQDYSFFLEKLGKHKHGKSCLNIKRLSDVDFEVLSALVKQAYLDCKDSYVK